MKKSMLTLAFLMSFSLGFSQKMFKSTAEIGEKPYIPTLEFKQKVSKLSDRPIQTEKIEFESFTDKDFYELSNGFISLYADDEWAHFRMIFDKKENWVETHVLHHADVLPENEYYKYMPKMKPQIESKQYTVEEFANYITVTNAKGFWYEVKASNNKNKNDIRVFIFDKDLKFVKMKKAIKV